jgi:hypothetical protein
VLKFHGDKPERIRQAEPSTEQIDAKVAKSTFEGKDLKRQSGTNERVEEIDHKTRGITFERIKQKLRRGKLKQSPENGKGEGLLTRGSRRRPEEQHQEHRKVSSITSAGQKTEHVQKMAGRSPSAAERVVVLWGLGGVG